MVLDGRTKEGRKEVKEKKWKERQQRKKTGGNEKSGG